MSLEQSIEKAAESLPAGWIVSVHVENGAAWVTAERPNGTKASVESSDRDLCEQVTDAVRLAFHEEAQNK
jgi:hypothetical protein